MPWNEPGNSNNKDPWTGRPKQTPPDLEAFLRNLFKKITVLFKLKSLNKNAAILSKTLFSSPFNIKIIGLIFSFLLLFWLFSGFFTVDSLGQAVVTRFGQYVATLPPGRHWILKPIESRYLLYPEKNIPLSYPINLLTRDKNSVFVNVKLHYSIANARQYLFSSSQPLKNLQEVTTNAVYQTLSQLSLEQLLTANLYALQQTLQTKITQSLDKYATGLMLNNVELEPIQAPEALKASFEDVARAQTDKEQLENQANIYAMQLKPTIQNQTQKLIADAKTYAQEVRLNAETETARFLALVPAYEASPELTRKRLYLETMQTIMQHNTKMLIDNPSNTSIYLSLNNSAQENSEKKENDATLKKPPMTLTDSVLPDTIDPTKNNNNIPSTYNITGGYE